MLPFLSAWICYHNDSVYRARDITAKKFIRRLPSLKAIIVTLQWAPWRLKSPTSRLFVEPFVQGHIEEHLNAPRHWSLWGEPTGQQWTSDAENVSIWWRHHENKNFYKQIVLFVSQRMDVILLCSMLKFSWYLGGGESWLGADLLYCSAPTMFIPNHLAIVTRLCVSIDVCRQEQCIKSIFSIVILCCLFKDGNFPTSNHYHDNVIKWKHFPRYWPFVRGGPPVTSGFPHRGQWRGALMFSSICSWTNSSGNNLDAVDLRRHRAHYDVTIRYHPIKSGFPDCELSFHWLFTVKSQI